MFSGAVVYHAIIQLITHEAFWEWTIQVLMASSSYAHRCNVARECVIGQWIWIGIKYRSVPLQAVCCLGFGFRFLCCVYQLIQIRLYNRNVFFTPIYMMRWHLEYFVLCRRQSHLWKPLQIFWHIFITLMIDMDFIWDISMMKWCSFCYIKCSCRWFLFENCLVLWISR